MGTGSTHLMKVHDDEDVQLQAGEHDMAAQHDMN